MQQAIDGLTTGQNMYEMNWKGVPPGQVEDAFTYLPMSTVLLAPAKWLTGDVRWGLALLTGVCSLLLLLAGSRRVPIDAAPSGGVVSACLLLLTAGHALQTEMAWTEPLILSLLLSAILATTRGHRATSVVMLALALAAKQHAFLLLPLFAAWRPFGVGRAAVAAGTAFLLCHPWALTAPRAMFRDTVTFLVDYPVSDRSSTVFAVLDRVGIALPLAVPLAILGAAIAVACSRVWRRPVSASEVCLWAASILLLASLVNKQAYYNQWWLAGSLVLAGIAFAGGESRDHASGFGNARVAPGNPR